MKTPEDCTGLADIREAIDRIDLDIVQALGRRMDYVKAASRFKASEAAIPAPERVAAMLPSAPAGPRKTDSTRPSSRDCSRRSSTGTSPSRSSTGARHGVPHEPAGALSQCLHALRGTFERAIGQAQALDRPVLVAASFEIDPLDPLQVFGAWDDRQTPCLYWEQPELAFFAWGCALELKGHGEQRFARIEENWQLLCADAVVEGPLAPRLCGGFRFDPRGPREEHWQAFADASLMLAGITVLREGERYRVLCQHLAKPGEDALALAAYHCSALLRLRQPARRRPSGPTAGAQGDASAQERRQWEAKVSDAVSSVRQGRFGKVVLARTQARPLGDIEPWQVIEHLRLQHADAQLFACRRGNACFLGASRNAWSAFAPARHSPMPWPGPSPAAAMPRKMRGSDRPCWTAPRTGTNTSWWWRRSVRPWNPSARYWKSPMRPA